MSRTILRVVPAAALLAAAGACWVPDLSWLDGKACDDAHPCVRGVCLAAQCVQSPPGRDASMPILVTRTVLRVQEDGSIRALPETPSPTELLVETTGGSFISLAPTIADAGLVVFWDAPQGPYLLRYGSRYFASDAGVLDLSEFQLGRADLEAPAPGTALRSQLDCLSGWDPRDEIRLTAVGAGLGALDLSRLDGWTTPNNGSPQINVSESWTSTQTPGLIRTSLGDRPIYAQLEYNAFTQGLSDGGQVSGDRWRATRFLAPASLDMASGVETTLERDCMRSSPIRNTQPVQVLGTLFSDHLAELGPGATLTGFTATVGHALWPGGPGPELSRATWGTPDDLDVAPQEVDNSLYPASWPQEASAVMTALVPVGLDLDGGTTTAFQQVTLATRRPYPVAGGVLAPALSPPRDVLVNGEVASGGMTGAGLQPEISWTEPALGTPAVYEVIVWRQQDPSRQKAARLEGSIWTDIPRVRLPPGLLAPRSTYVLHVRAVAAPLDARQAPLRAGLPFDEAVTVTGLIEP